MKRPFRYLAIAGLLVLTLVAVYRDGPLSWLPSFWHEDMRIEWENRDGARVMVIELRNTDTRTRWQSEDQDHRVTIHRRGPTLYELNITLVDARLDPPLQRNMNTQLQLEPGRTVVGGFRFAEPGKPVQRQVIEIVLPQS